MVRGDQTPSSVISPRMRPPPPAPPNSLASSAGSDAATQPRPVPTARSAMDESAHSIDSSRSAMIFSFDETDYSRRSRRRIRNWRAPASPRPRYAVDARHLRTGLLAAAVARGQEPLALPAPLPVFFITRPQLERDASLLIIVFSFVFISYSHYILMLIIEESLRLRPSKVSPLTLRANVAETTLPELIRDMSCK